MGDDRLFMKEFLAEIWRFDRKRYIGILFLNILSSVTAGVGIVMLVPMLGLLDISQSTLPILKDLPNLFSSYTLAQKALVVVLVYCVLIALKEWITKTSGIRQSMFIEDYGLHIRSSIYEAIAQADYETLSNKKHANVMNLFSNESFYVSYAASEALRVGALVISAAIQLGIAFYMNAPLTLAVLVFGSIFLVILRSFRKRAQNYGETLMTAQQKLLEELNNELNGIKEIRSYQVEEEQYLLTLRGLREVRDANVQYTRINTLPSMVLSIGAAIIIGAVGFLSITVFRTDTARIIVLVYIFSRLWPIFSQVQGMVQRISSVLPAYRAVQELIGDLETRTRDSAASESSTLDFKETIAFDHVDFAYRGTDKPAVRDITMTLRKGDIIAFAGNNGSGKSTLADLLMGFLVPLSGNILIDGVPLRSDNLPSWREKLNYIPQDPLILNASVRENLTRFHPNATEDEINDALEKAMALEIVRNLPQGLDTVLGERGVRLSGGEKQRVVLARALMGRPELLILDEATNAIDSISENLIQSAIRNLKNDITVVLVAHRYSTVCSADDVVVIEQGRVAEHGAPDVLLKNDASYLSRMRI